MPRKLFKGGNYSRKDTIRGNTVYQNMYYHQNLPFHSKEFATLNVIFSCVSNFGAGAPDYYCHYYSAVHRDYSTVCVPKQVNKMCFDKLNVDCVSVTLSLRSNISFPISYT